MGRLHDKPQESLSRRHFLAGASATAIAGALFSGAGCGVDGNGGGMKYRTLGRTGIMASVINSDELPERSMYEMAVKAGVNYWHKMGRWGDPEFFTRLDRDSFACDLTIDATEKDMAIEEFDRGLKKSGLGMIDGFKVHSVYDYPEDIKGKPGILQAFETLKKQGKTRFLMLSQHRNVVELMEAAIDSDLFDVLQVPVHPLMPHDYFLKEKKFREYAQDDYLGIIKKAADNNIGITSMKTVVGGPKNWEKIPGFKEKVSQYLPETDDIATALIHWSLAVPGVCTFASSMKSYDMFFANMRAVGSEITPQEAKGIQHFAEAASYSVCRMCGECERRNPGGIAVSDILRYTMYHACYGTPEKARKLYGALPRKLKVDMGKCLDRYEHACPYGLPLADMLRDAHRRLV
ncbi:hypothetical protein ACFL47_08635 [Candidatus Latescibacterota bacterium]